MFLWFERLIGCDKVFEVDDVGGCSAIDQKLFILFDFKAKVIIHLEGVRMIIIVIFHSFCMMLLTLFLNFNNTTRGKHGFLACFHIKDNVMDIMNCHQKTITDHFFGVS